MFLSDVFPTAWQAVEYAQVSPGDTVAVFGLGPIGRWPPVSRCTAVPGG